MPRLDGLAATRMLRTAEAAHQAEVLAAGMDVYLTRPIDAELLFATVARFLAGARVAA